MASTEFEPPPPPDTPISPARSLILWDIPILVASGANSTSAVYVFSLFNAYTTPMIAKETTNIRRLILLL